MHTVDTHCDRGDLVPQEVAKVGNRFNRIVAVEDPARADVKLTQISTLKKSAHNIIDELNSSLVR